MTDRVAAEAAFKISASNSGAKWPARQEGSRLGEICTPVTTSNFSLVPGESIFTIGSCFARNIEVALKQNGYQVPALEFSAPKEELWLGTKMTSGLLNKYTPHSMLNEVQFAFGDTTGEEFLVPESEGLYIDTQLHTNVAVSLERGIERRAEVRELYRSAIRDCRIIVVTLGLIEAWWDSESGRYLNETPLSKMVRNNPGRFQFEVLSPENTIDTVLETLRIMKANGHPDQKVLLTVSPVPLQRTFTADDVIVANTYSKAVLRVAAHKAVSALDWVNYYPSFESVTLSHPNVAWEDDLVHVRNEAIFANVQRMLALYSN